MIFFFCWKEILGKADGLFLTTCIGQEIWDIVVFFLSFFGSLIPVVWPLTPQGQKQFLEIPVKEALKNATG